MTNGDVEGIPLNASATISVDSTTRSPIGTNTGADESLRDSALARYAAGGLLLIAAFLKWHQVVTVADFGGFAVWDKWSTIGLVGFEFVLALLLLCGAFAPIMKWVAIALFTAFAGYNAWRWLGGYASCGCFGAVKIDPRITLVVDLSVVGLFLMSKAPPLASLRMKAERRVMLIAILGGLLLAIPAMSSMATVQPITLTTAGLAGGDRGAIRLEPTEWVGGRLPLLPYIKGVDVSRGEWLIVLWHPHCGHCRAALPGIVENARKTGESTLLLNITTDDEGDELRTAVAETPSLHALRLDPLRAWSAATPQYLVIHDGILTGVQ